jgi:hypothetical protein
MNYDPVLTPRPFSLENFRHSEELRRLKAMTKERRRDERRRLRELNRIWREEEIDRENTIGLVQRLRK